MAGDTSPRVFLIFGNGWIATHIKELLLASGKTVFTTLVRTENREQVLSELKSHRPTNVINCAGTRGTPNADWCEDHKVETVRSNVLGVLNLVDCCYQLGIHVTQIGSACIFDRELTPVPKAPFFTEEDEPFYEKSWYSKSRLLGEKTISHYPNLLILRIRLAIAPDLHPANLLTRLLKYDKIFSLLSSGTVLPNLLPGAILLVENEVTGIYNLMNPNPFTNNDVLALAKKHIRPDLTWENFEYDDMMKVLKVPRCNPVFDTTKLVTKLKELGYEVKDSHEALEDLFIEMKAKGI
ncbi:NAD(P)-binding protein [Hypoxylon sp. FL0543]|nr:NAD(P)-binding protein [Hypoxylon sp. FL0543]